MEKTVEIEPNVVRLMGKAQAELKAVVKVVPMEKYPFTIKDIFVKNEKNLEVVLTAPGQDKLAWEITVTNKKNRPGRYFDMITLVTDSALQPEIRINVFGNILE
ncbi:hypothetical protein [Desulfocicer niacini]